MRTADVKLTDPELAILTSLLVEAVDGGHEKAQAMKDLFFKLHREWGKQILAPILTEQQN